MKYDFKKLKAARERKLMTLTELAYLSKLSVATVYRVENGKAPWLKAIRQIAEVLQVKDVVLADDRRAS